LRELKLTTNGTQLVRYADELFAAGVRRINLSLDTLDADAFAAVTRWGKARHKAWAQVQTLRRRI
jgi:cyclic pyranopterin phosphate synthase